MWYKDAHLKIIDKQIGKWGFAIEEVSEIEPYDIEAVTIDTLLKQSELSTIDILKLDIEGSEKEIFSKNYKSWIERVNIIVIELHDRFKSGCTMALYSAININEWKEYKEGEKIILIRKKLLQN